MSRCAGCGHEHGLIEGWCDECIANGTRDRVQIGRGTLGQELSAVLAESARENMARSAKLPVDAEHALPLVGHVYEDASGRRLLVQGLKVGAKDGREVVGRMTNGFHERDFSTTLAIWAHVWRDKCPAADPRTMKVGG